jgi:outer membrane protein assembly factor BamB
MTKSDSQYRKVACPSCGAPLVIRPGDGRIIHCQFCGATIQAPEPPPPVTPPAPAGSQPSVLTLPLDFPAQDAGSTGKIALPIGCLVGAGIALAIGILLYLGFSPSAPETILRRPLSVTGAVPLLAGDPQVALDFIVTAFDVDADKYLFARVSAKDHKALWRGTTFDSISDFQGLTAVGDAFYSTKGTTLLAFNALDGSQRWSATLSDKLGYCAECLSVAGTRVIVLTQDYTFQVFDAATGDLVWQRRMAEYTRSFQLWNDSLLVVDKVDDSYSLLFLDIASGNIRQQITPSCKTLDGYSSEDLGTTSTFLVAPDSAGPAAGGALYLVYGWPESCVERRDLATGKLIWQQVSADGFSPGGDVYPVLTEDSLFLGFENTLLAAKTADGTFRTVLQAQDNSLVPLALINGTLIARAKTTRGSTRFSLWGLDPANGEKLWEHTLGKSGPMDPPDSVSGLVDDDQSAFTWRSLDGRFTILDFQANPNQLELQFLNTKDGNPGIGEKVAINVTGDFYFVPKVLGWEDPIVWLYVESSVLGVDIQSGKITYSYP